MKVKCASRMQAPLPIPSISFWLAQPVQAPLGSARLLGLARLVLVWLGSLWASFARFPLAGPVTKCILRCLWHAPVGVRITVSSAPVAEVLVSVPVIQRAGAAAGMVH